jgi:hypothetical protein
MECAGTTEAVLVITVTQEMTVVIKVAQIIVIITEHVTKMVFVLVTLGILETIAVS